MIKYILEIDDVLKGNIIEEIKNSLFEEYLDLSGNLVQNQRETHQNWIEGIS